MDPGSRSGPVQHRCGTRTLGRTPSVRPWNRCVKSCFIINCQLLTLFTSETWLQKRASSTLVPSSMWNTDTGVNNKCPAMERMCQIIFYNQFATSDTIHKWTLTIEVAVSTLVPSPMWNPDTRCVKCVKSCFVINCQLLTPFTSGHWLQKWEGSTSVPSPIWNPDTGADSKCPAMEPMCQIIFYNQLPTSDTIHKWTLAPEVGMFHIGGLTDVELGPWGGHQVSGRGNVVSNHVL